MTRPPVPDLPERELRALLRTARGAAAAVGAMVRRHHIAAPRSDVRRKGHGDFVTAIDVAGERQLREHLLSAHPDHGFVGEESAPTRPDADCVWIVDPIDGTSNFAQGLSTFAVAIACVHRGWPIVAAAWCAPEDVVFSAAAGRGAWRGSRRLFTPRAPLDDAAVVGVQWFRGAWEPGLLEPICRSGARVRTLGSTVTQICDVASGRLHANIQSQGRIWDIVAPALIAIEAGARFTDWSGRAILPFADLTEVRHYPSLTAPEPIHSALRRAVGPLVVSPA